MSSQFDRDMMSNPRHREVKTHHGRYFVINLELPSRQADAGKDFIFSQVNRTKMEGMVRTPQLNMKVRSMKLVGYSYTIDDLAPEWQSEPPVDSRGCTMLNIEFVGNSVENPETYHHGQKRRFMPLLVEVPPSADADRQFTKTVTHMSDELQLHLDPYDDRLSEMMLNHFAVRVTHPSASSAITRDLPSLAELTLVFRIEEQLVSTVRS